MKATVALYASRSVIPIDMILDSGASDVMFPADRDENSCTDIQLVDGSLNIGEKSQIPAYARAKYGILDPIILCSNLMYALVAVSFLTNRLNYTFSRLKTWLIS